MSGRALSKPCGRPASLTRQLLRRLHIDRIREIVDFYELARAKSAEDMILQIIRRAGTELDELVSPEGPYTTDVWNEIAEELGGQTRKSLDGIRAELTHRLDRVCSVGDTLVHHRRRMADSVLVDEPELRPHPGRIVGRLAVAQRLLIAGDEALDELDCARA